MVIARTPLRISVAGGGTDLPIWYRDHGSMFISAAIDKYIYTTVHYSNYNPNTRLRYSIMEEVEDVDELKNEIARETLNNMGINGGLEITSHAEIPSGTGLGSSGSFGVGLLHALNPYAKQGQLAIDATDVQMNKLEYPIGEQDQWITALGGVRRFDVSKSGDVKHTEIISEGLDENLVLFYTQIKRDANEVLSGSKIDGLDFIQDLAYKAEKYLRAGDYDAYGMLLNDHWEHKKKRGGMTSSGIDDLYELGMKNGALGGKIVGAGGGGFLMFYTRDREKLVEIMPLQQQEFKFDYEGSTIIYG